MIARVTDIGDKIDSCSQYLFIGLSLALKMLFDLHFYFCLVFALLIAFTLNMGASTSLSTVIYELFCCIFLVYLASFCIIFILLRRWASLPTKTPPRIFCVGLIDADDSRMLPTVGPSSARGLKIAFGIFDNDDSSISSLASYSIIDKLVDLNGYLLPSIVRLYAFNRSNELASSA